MRVLMIVVVAAMLVVVMGVGKAEAAAQFSIWPADFAYGTPPPAGNYAWSATTYGLRFDEPLGPFVALRTTLAYGPVTNLTFNGAALSGYNGYSLLADSVVRVGFGAGPVGVAAYAGYGGMFFNVKGPNPPDTIVLTNLVTRLGLEATVATSHGLELRGNFTWFPSLNATANISTTTPAVTFPNTPGTGSGSEYEVALVYSPTPVTTLFAGYRGGTSQISWSGGGGSTSSSYHGVLVGVELHF